MKSLKFLMKMSSICGMLAAVGLPLNLVAQATITLFPQDADGWSIVAPLADSRVIHVSSSMGSDAADGLSLATPVRTLARGFSLLRNNSADQMLLRRGDLWEGETFGALRDMNGHSAMQRLLIGAYGEGGARPIVDTGIQGIINTDGSTSSNFAVIGIDFYASGRDPGSPNYAGHNATGFAAGFRFVGRGDNILFEDCRIRYYGTALEFDGNEGRYSNVVVRRNILYHSWRPNSYIIHVFDSRSQGFYASGVDGFLMEENLFHHNGWNQVVPFAGANMFNHNVYLQYSLTDSVFRGNMLSMASAHGAQLRSGGYADDNFFARNAISMNLGGHGAPTAEANPWGLARNNVIIEGRLMDPNSTFGLRTSALWALSSDYFPSTAIRNLIANRIHSGSNRAFSQGSIGGWTLQENTVFQWDSAYDQANPGWLAPDRNVESYAAANGLGSAYADFWAIAADRPAGVWDYSLSAYALNEYLWEGFTVPGAAYLRSSHSSLWLPATATERSVRVYHSATTTVDDLPAWIFAEWVANSDHSQLLLSLSANPDEQDRSATITLLQGDLIRSIEIIQDGAVFIPELELSQSNLILTGVIPFEVAINSNTSWTVSSTASWLTITPTSGTGNGTLRITATRNLAVTMRTAAVLIQGDELSRTLTIFQQPDSAPTSWAGWPISDGTVDTGNFLGVLDVSLDPYVWGSALDAWLYLPQSFVQQDGSWFYLYR